MNKKVDKSFGRYELILYLCNRKSEMTAMVPWMSGLVNGLQNRLRRFESARHLIKATNNVGCFFVILSRQLSSTFLYSTFFPSGYPPVHGRFQIMSPIVSIIVSPQSKAQTYRPPTPQQLRTPTPSRKREGATACCR